MPNDVADRLKKIIQNVKGDDAPANEQEIRGYVKGVEIPADQQNQAVQTIAAGGMVPLSKNRTYALTEAGHEDPAAWREAFDDKGRVSSLVHRLLKRKIPCFKISGAVIATPSDFAALMLPLRTPYFESLKVAFLNQRGRVVHGEILTVGTINQSVFSSSDIVLAAQEIGIRTKTRRVIISHNHPSSDPNPSADDLKITRDLETALPLVGMEFVDHVITNGRKFWSYKGGLGENLMGSNAPWEGVPREELVRMGGPAGMKGIVNALRQGDPDYGHVLYLNMKCRLVAVERVSVCEENHNVIRETICQGLAREGAVTVILDYGNAVPVDSARRAVRVIETALKAFHRDVLDVAAGEVSSFREAGMLGDSQHVAIRVGEESAEESEGVSI